MPIVFLILRGSFSGFWANLSQRGSRNCIGFQAFQSDLCQFFIGLHAKFYWLVCQNCTLRARRIVFMGYIYFEKKNTFPFVFHNLGANFSSFRQNFNITVVGTSLVSRFFNRIYAIFSEFTQNYNDRSVRTALYVSTGSFSWEASSLNKKHFSNYISHFGQRLFRFSAKVFQHGRKNCIGF